MLKYIVDRQHSHASTQIKTLASRLLNDNPQKRPFLGKILDDLIVEEKKEEVDLEDVQIVAPEEPFNHR